MDFSFSMTYGAGTVLAPSPPPPLLVWVNEFGDVWVNEFGEPWTVG